MSRRTQLAVLWVVTLVLVYAGPAEWVASRIEGIDGDLLPLWPTFAAAGIFVAALVATLRPARKTGLAAETSSGRRTSRRTVLVGMGKVTAGTLAVGAAVLFRLRGWLTVTGPAIAREVQTTDPNPAVEWAGARIEAYRKLGRTGFEVSDVSLGSGRIREDNGGEAIARAAIERGVNYFDTAPDYSGAGSERALGKALEGRRDKIFIATKFCTPEGHLPTGSSVDDYVGVVEASLKRLGTDYVDLVHVHSCDSVRRLLDPNVHEAFDRLKQQGKARFLGVSTHTPNLEQVASAAVDSGRFDVMMLAYHHGAWPKLGEIIHRGHEKGMGIVAMKTLKGAKHDGLEGFRAEKRSYAQAAFKWVLSNPEVSCLVVSFFDPQHVDEYLAASGKPLGDTDVALLRKYDGLVAGTHCRQHCGQCLDSCPEELAIDDILRYRMYAEDYRWPEEGRRLYAKLDKQASVCAGCPAPCAGACPDGIAIRPRLIGAHRMLA